MSIGVSISSRDFFIIVGVLSFLTALVTGSFKLQERLNKKIELEQFNRKQTIIIWAEVLIIMSTSIYYGIIGMYNSMGESFGEKVNLNEPTVGLLIILGYMKYAFIISLIVWLIGFVLLKLLKGKPVTK